MTEKLQNVCIDVAVTVRQLNLASKFLVQEVRHPVYFSYHTYTFGIAATGTNLVSASGWLAITVLLTLQNFVD